MKYLNVTNLNKYLFVYTIKQCKKGKGRDL